MCGWGTFSRLPARRQMHNPSTSPTTPSQGPESTALRLTFGSSQRGMGRCLQMWLGHAATHGG
eukprot:9042650-Pyramimonas_sp.AAC.1